MEGQPAANPDNPFLANHEPCAKGAANQSNPFLGMHQPCARGIIGSVAHSLPDNMIWEHHPSLLNQVDSRILQGHLIHLLTLTTRSHTSTPLYGRDSIFPPQDQRQIKCRTGFCNLPTRIWVLFLRECNLLQCSLIQCSFLQRLLSQCLFLQCLFLQCFPISTIRLTSMLMFRDRMNRVSTIPSPIISTLTQLLKLQVLPQMLLIFSKMVAYSPKIPTAMVQGTTQTIQIPHTR